MRKITKEDIEWVVDTCFGRHKDKERVKNQLSIYDLTRILLTTWEAGNPLLKTVLDKEKRRLARLKRINRAKT